VGKAFAALRSRTGQGSATKRSAAASGHWHSWARRFDWRARAEAWDAHLDREVRAAQVEAVRKLQERHQLQLRHLSNKLIAAGQDVDFSRLSPEQLVRLTGEVIRLERLVHNEPISVERHEHTGAADAPPVAHQVAVRSTFEPTPEFMASVMGILAAHGGLTEAEEPEVATAAGATHDRDRGRPVGDPPRKGPVPG
jgi:hypothetical protein